MRKAVLFGGASLLCLCLFLGAAVALAQGSGHPPAPAPAFDIGKALRQGMWMGVRDFFLRFLLPNWYALLPLLGLIALKNHVERGDRRRAKEKREAAIEAKQRARDERLAGMIAQKLRGE